MVGNFKLDQKKYLVRENTEHITSMPYSDFFWDTFLYHFSFFLLLGKCLNLDPNPLNLKLICANLKNGIKLYSKFGLKAQYDVPLHLNH